MATKPAPYFTATNTTFSYGLRFHYGWYTHRRQPTFADTQTQTLVADSFNDVSGRYNYRMLEMEVEPMVLRALLSLRPTDSPSATTRTIKGNLATDARNQLGISKLWSRGWFVRSVGRCTNEVIRRYVASQYGHHRSLPIDAPEAALRAAYHHPGNASRMRKIAHAVFEYNVHVVLVTRRRREFLDLEVAEALVDYWRSVCEEKRWIPWEVNVVWNHAHLLLGLDPTDAPGEVALSLMNNSAWFLEKRHGAVLERERMTGVWMPSCYVGTVGSATTSQVKGFLRGDGRPG